MSTVNPSQASAGEEITTAKINTPINQLAAEINGNINADNLAANAVTTAKIADSTVSAAKLATGATHLGYDLDAGTTLTTSYVAAQSVTATSTGKSVLVTVGGYIYNANSGANRTYDLKLVVDGVDVETVSGVALVYIAGASAGHWYNYTFKHTPTAASHTWALHLKASAGASVVSYSQYMEVREVV